MFYRPKCTWSCGDCLSRQFDASGDDELIRVRIRTCRSRRTSVSDVENGVIVHRFRNVRDVEDRNVDFVVRVRFDAGEVRTDSADFGSADSGVDGRRGGIGNHFVHQVGCGGSGFKMSKSLKFIQRPLL